MPKSYVIVGGNSHDLMTDKKRSFFELPKQNFSPERRDKWLSAIHREKTDGSHWSPPKSSTICSDHFINGKPVKDPLHPDYVPTILPRKPGSRLKAQRSVKRYLQHETSVKKRHCSRKIFDDTELTADSDNAELYPPLRTVDCEPECEPNEQENLIEMLWKEVNSLRQERDKALEQCKTLEMKLDKVRLSASSIDGDVRSQFYTGLPYDIFLKTFDYLSPFVQGKTKDSMPFIDQFFITLTRLRLDLSFDLIAFQTGYGETTVRDYFWKWVDVTYAKLSFMVRWPDRESIVDALPPEFKEKFPRLTSIIDCFEVFVEASSDLKARGQTYSNYKKHTTTKFLIAYTPLGAISFVSKAWGGRVSDVQLVRRSGFISSDMHYPGDQILADRGFTLQDDFATICSAELIIPAFTKGKDQLEAEEIETSREMSAIRIHVERVIGLLKNRYTILQGTLPIIMIKSLKDEADEEEAASIDRLLLVCAALVNLGGSIVFKG